MKTSMKTEGTPCFRPKLRAVALAALLSGVLLAPVELLAQARTKSSTGGGSRGSSSSSSSGRSSSSSVSSSSGSVSSSSGGSVSRSPGSTRSGGGFRRSRNARKAGPRPIYPTPAYPTPAIPSLGNQPPTRDPVDADAEKPPVSPPSTEKPRPRPPDRPRYPYYPYYPPYFDYYDYYFYNSYLGFPYFYFHGPYGYSSYAAGPRYRDALGALDLNVKPKRAEVYIDGDPVGPVDRYDGFPTYLWLAPGTYTLSFFLEGYETLTREYRVHPGLVIKVKERLKRGVAVEPVELFGSVPAAQPPAAQPPAPEPRAEVEREAEPAPPRKVLGEESIGRIQLSVRPGDAAVYLDGHFLGTAEELAQLSAGLIVEPGDHRLELVRPGYKTEQLRIDVSKGERIEIDTELQKR